MILQASVVRPVKELKDFKKVTLLPGEEKKGSLYHNRTGTAIF